MINDLTAICSTKFENPKQSRLLTKSRLLPPPLQIRLTDRRATCGLSVHVTIVSITAPSEESTKLILCATREKPPYQIEAPLPPAVDQAERQVRLVGPQVPLEDRRLLAGRQRRDCGQLQILLVLPQVIDELHLVLGEAEGAELGLAAAAILEQRGALLQRRDVLEMMV
jgi:hypothetical protein